MNDVIRVARVAGPRSPAARPRPPVVTVVAPRPPARPPREGALAVLVRLGRRRLRAALIALRREDGMSTAEYAVGTLAAVALAAVLYKIVTGSAVNQALTGIVTKALRAPF